MARRPLPPYVIGPRFDVFFGRMAWVVIGFAFWYLFFQVAWYVISGLPRQ